MFDSTPFIRNFVNRRRVDGDFTDAHFVALVKESRLHDERVAINHLDSDPVHYGIARA